MEIYLMRHADALPQQEWDRDDASRPLSDFGRKRLSSALPDMKSAGFLPELVLSSPYVRARETADLICTILPGKKPVLRPSLSSGTSISAIRGEVTGNKQVHSVLIIGHMPDLAHFASGVTGDPWLLEEGHMEPAAIWALESGDLASSWGKGGFIWRRNLNEWKIN